MKVTILTSVLAILGAGNAAAFDAAQGFGFSDANDQPIPRYQRTTPIDGQAVTSSVGSASKSYSYSTGAIRSSDYLAGTGKMVGFSAAQGFGPSDENDLPAPRFQIAR